MILHSRSPRERRQHAHDLQRRTVESLGADHHRQLTITAGTATAGTDYTSTNGTLTFVPNDTLETITVQIIGDPMFEPDETITVTLSAPVNATIFDGTATGTIQNDDAQPTISIADSSTTEGDAGTTPMTFTVTLSNPSATTITVNYATSDVAGGAIAGTDYTPASGTLTFAPGDVSETFDVAIIGDTIDEANETFNVTLSAPVNATIAAGTAIGTIIDNDAQPTISIADSSATEGDAGTTSPTRRRDACGPAGWKPAVRSCGAAAASAADVVAMNRRPKRAALHKILVIPHPQARRPRARRLEAGGTFLWSGGRFGRRRRRDESPPEAGGAP